MPFFTESLLILIHSSIIFCYTIYYIRCCDQISHFFCIRQLVHPSDMMSPVRYPSVRTCLYGCLYCICLFVQDRVSSGASLLRKGSLQSGLLYSVLRYPVRIRGLAHTDQIWSHLRLAEESIPMEPVTILASSDKISPNMFSVRITSNCAGFMYKLHCTVVNQHMLQSYFRIILCHFFYDFSPESGRIQNVCLVYACDFLSSLHCDVKAL